VAGRKFGIDVETPRDITLINDKIREKLKKSRSQATIDKHLAQSRYLYTLTFSPAWKKDLRGRLTKVRARAKSQYCKNVRLANKILRDLKINHVVYTTMC